MKPPVVVRRKTGQLRRPWDRLSDDLRVRELHAEGKTVHQIAVAMGRTGMMIYGAHDRLELTPNVKSEAQRAASAKALAARREGPKPKRSVMNGPPAEKKGVNLESPITAAHSTFGSRLVEKHGSFYLDGRPIGLNDLLRRTNAQRKEWFLPQVGRNPAWLV